MMWPYYFIHMNHGVTVLKRTPVPILWPDLYLTAEGTKFPPKHASESNETSENVSWQFEPLLIHNSCHIHCVFLSAFQLLLLVLCLLIEETSCTAVALCEILTQVLWGAWAEVPAPDRFTFRVEVRLTLNNMRTSAWELWSAVEFHGRGHQLWHALKKKNF